MSNQVYQNAQEKFYPMLGSDKFTILGDYYVAGAGAISTLPFTTENRMSPGTYLSLQLNGSISILESGIYALTASVQVESVKSVFPHITTPGVDPWYSIYFKLNHLGQNNDQAVYGEQWARWPNLGGAEGGPQITPISTCTHVMGFVAGDNIELELRNEAPAADWLRIMSAGVFLQISRIA